MKVNVAVCGKFHYHNYIKYLHQQGLLNRFYYSHKRSTSSTTLGVPLDKLVNIWGKEYLVMGHAKLFNNKGTNQLFPLYHDLWQTLALKAWSSSDLFHLMLHGTGLKLLERAKNEGTKTIGEPVNSHPAKLVELLSEEYARLGLKKRLTLHTAQKRLILELEQCDYLVVASNFLKQSYIEMGFDGDKIFVLPYGVNLSRFYPLSPPNQNLTKPSFRVIYVAQISPRKGLVYLLEAWKQLNLKDAELLVIGAVQDEMKPVLAKYTGLFTHIPRVANEQLREYYSSSDVFVLPSLEDGFAYVVPEAMACGLPVITTVNTGASELIEHGKQGFVVPIRSSVAIAEYLELLYHNPQIRQQMGQAALNKAQTVLGWEQYATKLSDIYTAVEAKTLVLSK